MLARESQPKPNKHKPIFKIRKTRSERDLRSELTASRLGSIQVLDRLTQMIPHLWQQKQDPTWTLLAWGCSRPQVYKTGSKRTVESYGRSQWQHSHCLLPLRQWTDPLNEWEDCVFYVRLNAPWFGLWLVLLGSQVRFQMIGVKRTFNFMAMTIKHDRKVSQKTQTTNASEEKNLQPFIWDCCRPVDQLYWKVVIKALSSSALRHPAHKTATKTKCGTSFWLQTHH